MPRLIAAVPLPTMRASRPGECAGRAWRDYSGRAAVRRSKRCDLVTPKAKRKVARVARPTADHVERARRRTNDTLFKTFRLPTEVCSDFLRSGTSAIRCLLRQKQTPDEWNCTKARDGGPCPSFRHSSQAERKTPHPPPSVRAFITACREGDFRGAACPTAART
jgi:hypothetical protein